MKINIGASYDSFRDLRQSGSYYIDKTEIIKEYLIDNSNKAVMFARPRRFGKTLTMTMFRDFLDIKLDSKDLFEGLKIMGYRNVVDEHMNQYPVVFLSLKNLQGDTYQKIFSNFKIILANLCKSLNELLNSNSVDEDDKEIFALLKKQKADEANSVAALDLLCRMLHDHYKKQVFVIIDEYDVPMAKTAGTPAYEDVRNMIEQMLSYICKTNENVKAVMLSGCLYTVKNSTYTGVNNIIPFSILSPIFASSIGFTDDDVKKLLYDAGISNHYELVQEWYDGYLFGRDKMYCPWDVLLYVDSVLKGSYSEINGPDSYWLNTSETALDMIHGFLGKTAGVIERFEKLLAGETIDCVVKENIPYHRLYESGENIWSALLETGYLTKVVTERMTRMPLRIPNREIQDVFRQEIWDYFKDKVDNAFVSDLVNALWTGQGEKAGSALNQILEATLSFYHEYHEYSYHLILSGFFTGHGYRVLSEQESGYGRSDLIILDVDRKRCLILELKHVKEENQMEAALQEAFSQIIDKNYGSNPRYFGYTYRIRYGMAFWKKKCRIIDF